MQKTYQVMKKIVNNTTPKGKGADLRKRTMKENRRKRGGVKESCRTQKMVTPPTISKLKQWKKKPQEKIGVPVREECLKGKLRGDPKGGEKVRISMEKGIRVGAAQGRGH